MSDLNDYCTACGHQRFHHTNGYGRCRAREHDCGCAHFMGDAPRIELSEHAKVDNGGHQYMSSQVTGWEDVGRRQVATDVLLVCVCGATKLLVLQSHIEDSTLVYA